MSNLITQTVRELKKIPQVQAVILYGSYAKGTQKPISDIDICALTEKNISEETKGDIWGQSGRKVDAVWFWDLPPLIRYAALREGKFLFVRNEAFLQEATIETMSEYLDFRHIIDRSIARMVEA